MRKLDKKSVCNAPPPAPDVLLGVGGKPKKKKNCSPATSYQVINGNLKAYPTRYKGVRTLWSAVILAIFIGGYLVVNTFFNEKDVSVAIEEEQTEPEAEAINPLADNDSDGLLNAQEEEYGTDPDNPDTDGDGYSDGEEVKNGYNPLE